MKVVDEKGKIFGKLNIIDLLVILLLVAAVVLVGYKVTHRSESAGGTATVLTYTVECSAVKPEVYESVKAFIDAAEEGDQLMANGEMVSAWITGVSAVPHEGNATLSSNNDGSLVLPVDADTLDLTFTIKANVANTVTNEVGSQEVRVGKNHIVKSIHFEITGGVILTCDWETQQG